MRTQPGLGQLPRVGNVRLGSLPHFRTRSRPATQKTSEESKEIQLLDRPVVKAGCLILNQWGGMNPGHRGLFRDKTRTEGRPARQDGAAECTLCLAT